MSTVRKSMVCNNRQKKKKPQNNDRRRMFPESFAVKVTEKMSSALDSNKVNGKPT